MHICVASENLIRQSVCSCFCEFSSFFFTNFLEPIARSSMRRDVSRSTFLPVPAGISLPMITFSLRPSSLSTLPLTAASVRTVVVSWKDAADKNESVSTADLEMPKSNGPNFAGFFPSNNRSFVNCVHISE